MGTLSAIPTVTAEQFDYIINLVSEIVIVRARLQQLAGVVVQESRTIKQIYADALGLTEAVEALCNKSAMGVSTTALQQLRQQCTDLTGNQGKAILYATALELDESIGRFGKVVSELQNALMKMGVGDSHNRIIQVLLVRVGGAMIAFPLASVLEIVKVHNEDIYSVDGNETIKLREHVLGLVHLEKTIGLVQTGQHEKQGKRVVVITDGKERIGVIVDELCGEEEVVTKPLSSHFDRVQGVQGVSVLGDGAIALIIDTAEVLMAANKR